MALQNTVLIAIMGFAALAVVVATMLNPRSIRIYWQRSCTGRAWRRAFPQVPKQEIRRFLYLFVDAFAFPKNKALCFAPTDRILPIYNSLYPIKGWPDALELETLALRLEASYGINLRDIWREDLTIGDLFSKTKAAGLEVEAPANPA
jgi:propanediol dehydratase small subunit